MTGKHYVLRASKKQATMDDRSRSGAQSEQGTRSTKVEKTAYISVMATAVQPIYINDGRATYSGQTGFVQGSYIQDGDVASLPSRKERKNGGKRGIKSV